MNIFLVTFAALLSISSHADTRNTPSFSESFYRSTAGLYLKAIDILRSSDEVEGEYASRSHSRTPLFLIEDAFAKEPTGCLCAGWQGKITKGRCRVSTDAYLEAKNSCSNSDGRGTVPCNPDLFPGGLCIKPESQAWTKDCVKQFFKREGISADYQSDGSVLMKPEEMTRLGKSLQARGVNLSKAIMDAEAVCFHVRLKDRADCEILPKMYISTMQEASPEERQAIFSVQKNTRQQSLLENRTRKVRFPRTKDTCKKVDNDLEKEKVYDQAYGSCYAYAATQVMNQGLIRKYGKDKAPVASATATALQYGAFTGDRSEKHSASSPIDGDHFLGTHGGWTANALRATNSFGYCPESVFMSANGAEVEGNWAEFRIAFDNYQKKKSRMRKCEPLPPVGDLDKAMAPINQKVLEDVGKTDPGRVKAIEAALKAHYQFLLQNTEDFDTFFFRYLQNICTATRIDNRPVMAPPDAVQFFDRSVTSQRGTDALLKAVHQDLENGNITAFSYYTDDLISTPSKGHGLHASVITGREYLDAGDPLLGGRKPGCYLVVKNSWGSDWPYESTKKKFNRVIFDPTRPGRFLISEAELAKSAFEYTEVVRK